MSEPTQSLAILIITYGGAAVAVFGSIIWAAVTFGSWKEKMKNVDSLKNSIDGLNKSMYKVEAILEFMNQKNNTLIQTNSPLNLSPVGETYNKELKLTNMVQNHWNDIRNQLIKKLPSDNLYDIQMACISYAEDSMDSIFTKDEIDLIKDHAFKNGAPYDHYKTLVGIIIRNTYFHEKGINIDEIDNYDPNKQK